MLTATQNDAILAIGAAFDEPVLKEVARALPDITGKAAAQIVTLTARAGYSPRVWEPILRACAQAGIGVETTAPQRFILIHAAKEFLPKIEALPVCESVKEFIYGEYCFVAKPRRLWQAVLADPKSKTFKSTCRVICCERFPAGQLHWEVSGFPRSWLLKVPPGKIVPMLSFIATRMRGFSPYFEPHMTTRWTVPFVVRQEEEERSYLRAAECMRLQPHIKGILSTSWLNDPHLHRLDDHLSWRLDKLNNGAFLTLLGHASTEAGYTRGSPRREELIRSGAWKPRQAAILWPRKAVLRWSESLREVPFQNAVEVHA
jgi:hypothetical protein